MLMTDWGFRRQWGRVLGLGGWGRGDGPRELRPARRVEWRRNGQKVGSQWQKQRRAQPVAGCLRLDRQREGRQSGLRQALRMDRRRRK